jgi:uncharacterized membrane protein
LDVVDGKEIDLEHFITKTRAQWNMIIRRLGGYITMIFYTIWPLIIVGAILSLIALLAGDGMMIMERLQSLASPMDIILPIIAAIIAIALVIYMVRTSIQLSFRQYFMIDKNMSIKASLQASRNMTKNHLGQLVSVGILSAGIMFLGILCLFIGSIRAIPTVMLATAFLYRKVSG